MLTYQAVAKPRTPHIVATTNLTTLHNYIVALKLLDEGKIDPAKSFLEANLRASVKAAPRWMDDLDDSPLKRAYAQTAELGRLALSDRAKSFEQLNREMAK